MTLRTDPELGNVSKANARPFVLLSITAALVCILVGTAGCDSLGVDDYVESEQVQKSPSPPLPVDAPNVQRLEGDVDSEIFEVVEVMPQLIGGLGTLAGQIRYPFVVEGELYKDTVVDEQGSAADPDLYREVTELLRHEILARIIEAGLEQSANVEVTGLTGPGQSKIE